MKLQNIILSVVFLLILLLPVGNQVFNFFVDIENTENRAMAEMPEFRIENLDPFPSKFEAYYQDHFFMRNWFNNKWSIINRKIFKKSPTDKVIIGMDDWLYTKKEELETYLGENLFTDEELILLKQEIIRRRDYLNSVNCKYYFVIAPTKYSIYPEYLPRIYQTVDNYTSTDQVVDLVSGISNVELIDLREVLKGLKDQGFLFRASDNHWNALGGYYAYAEIINRIKKDFPDIGQAFPLDSFNISTREVTGGNIAHMMNASDDYLEIIPEIEFKNQKVWKAEKAGYVCSPYFGFPNEHELVFTNNVEGAPKVLLIRDSFGFAITPFIPAHFSKTVMIFDEWKYMLNQAIVEKEQPDIFIQMTLEAYYTNLLANAGK